MEFMYGHVKVYYEQHGTGKDVLLLHGWGGRCESWLPVIRDFSGSCRLTVLDFPGHGRSDEPDVPWSVDEYAEMTLALLDELGISKTDIIAHSFGCRVSILMAADHPERLGKLLLTGAAGIKAKTTGEKSFKNKLYGVLKNGADNKVTRRLFGTNVDVWRRKLGTAFGSEDYKKLSDGMRVTFNKVIHQDLEPKLHLIQSPVLLFWGRDDTATPLWMGERMEELIPDAGLVVYDGTGHFAYLDRYPDFCAVAKNFLL